MMRTVNSKTKKFTLNCIHRNRGFLCASNKHSARPASLRILTRFVAVGSLCYGVGARCALPLQCGHAQSRSVAALTVTLLLAPTAPAVAGGAAFGWRGVATLLAAASALAAAQPRGPWRGVAVAAAPMPSGADRLTLPLPSPSAVPVCRPHPATRPAEASSIRGSRPAL